MISIILTSQCCLNFTLFSKCCFNLQPVFSSFEELSLIWEVQSGGPSGDTPGRCPPPAEDTSLGHSNNFIFAGNCCS